MRATSWPTLAAGRRVLDAFAYTGGFAVAALAGRRGARGRCSSPRRARWRWRGRTSRSPPRRADVPCARTRSSALHAGVDDFDLVILDPPPLARRKARRPGAPRAPTRTCCCTPSRRAAPGASCSPSPARTTSAPTCSRRSPFGAALDAAAASPCCASSARRPITRSRSIIPRVATSRACCCGWTGERRALPGGDARRRLRAAARVSARARLLGDAAAPPGCACAARGAGRAAGAGRLAAAVGRRRGFRSRARRPRCAGSRCSTRSDCSTIRSASAPSRGCSRANRRTAAGTSPAPTKRAASRSRGEVAGLLAKTPSARASALRRAEGFLARHWSVERVQGPCYAPILAYVHALANLQSELADEVLQWCGRELERGFRTHSFDAGRGGARVPARAGARVARRQHRRERGGGDAARRAGADGGWSAEPEVPRALATLEAVEALLRLGPGAA